MRWKILRSLNLPTSSSWNDQAVGRRRMVQRTSNPNPRTDLLTQTRAMLGRRFDDLENGLVEPIDGEEAFRLLMEKTEAQRRRSSV